MSWEKQLTHGSKHLLLCDIVSRLPEDVQAVLDDLGLKGKKKILLRKSINIKKEY